MCYSGHVGVDLPVEGRLDDRADLVGCHRAGRGFERGELLTLHQEPQTTRPWWRESTGRLLRVRFHLHESRCRVSEFVEWRAQLSVTIGSSFVTFVAGSWDLCSSFHVHAHPELLDVERSVPPVDADRLSDGARLLCSETLVAHRFSFLAAHVPTSSRPRRR